MTSVQWETVRVVSLGGIDLDLTSGVIGTGNPPFVSLISLIHGNEAIGTILIHKILENLVDKLNFHGSLRLIPVANPLAALTYTRASFLDMLDMNRIGTGSDEGQVTERITKKLYELITGSEIVIVFHEFELDSALTCVYTSSGSDLVRAKSLQGMLAFNPEVIWLVPSSDEDKTMPIYSFDSIVANSGTPIFSVEFARADLVTPDMVDKCVSKIEDILEELGVVERKQVDEKKLKQTPIVVRRQAIYSTHMGIWVPEVNLMSEVVKGQIVGTLFKLPDFSRESIQSLEDGIILQIRPYEFIKSNSIIFSLGKREASFL